MALPSLVCSTKKCNMAMRSKAAARIMICKVLIVAPNTLTWLMATGSGKRRDWVLTQMNTPFCNMIDTPIAEINGARREMCRSGR